MKLSLLYFLAILSLVSATVFGASDETAHQKVAQAYADRYYRFEDRLGSNSVKVTEIAFDIEGTTEVPGWFGRFRTSGKAFIEYYDSKGRSFNRVTREFEILTEQKEGEAIKVIDFTKKR